MGAGMNLEVLQAGIQWWSNNKRQWGTGFLNEFYDQLYAQRPNQLNEQWWDSTVEVLASWRAIRSPKPPNTKEEIRTRGLTRLPLINQYYQEIRRFDSGEPTLENTNWDNIARLYDVLCQIKGTKSPVLPSKLGHFLLPRVFIVIDNEATAIFPYEFIWRMLRLAWMEYQEKDQAKEILAAKIRQDQTTTINPNYPFETKIPELWLIGYKHR
jgi:hypothetical protein